MAAKIHIDIKQGTLSVEGDSRFVRQVYSDYKGGILGQIAPPALLREEQTDEPVTKRAKPISKKRRQQSRSETPAKNENGSVDPKKPKLDRDLDLKISNLKQFCSQLRIDNVYEAILVFAKYMIDELGIEKPNTDQIFTCFRAVKRRTPRDFSQAFRQTKSTHGYIDYESLKEGLTITNIGYNHFDEISERNNSAE